MEKVFSFEEALPAIKAGKKFRHRWKGEKKWSVWTDFNSADWTIKNLFDAEFEVMREPLEIWVEVQGLKSLPVAWSVEPFQPKGKKNRVLMFREVME